MIQKLQVLVSGANIPIDVRGKLNCFKKLKLKTLLYCASLPPSSKTKV